MWPSCSVGREGHVKLQRERWVFAAAALAGKALTANGKRSDLHLHLRSPAGGMSREPKSEGISASPTIASSA
jgi:hypothetical protein